MSEFKKSKMLEEFVFDKNIYKIGDKIKVTRRMTRDQSHPFRCYEGVFGVCNKIYTSSFG